MTEDNRYAKWFMVAAFSTIALVSLTGTYDDEKIGDQPKEVKWAVSAISISLTFSALAVFANFLLKEKFVGTVIEGGLALLTCAFWAAVLPSIMDPDHALAVRDTSGTINDANLYFFSWGSFLMSFFVLFHFSKQRYMGDDEDKARRRCKLMSWAGLTATSFVVMVNASRFYESFDCKNIDSNGADTCRRLKYAVSLGTISAIVALIWLIVSKCLAGRFGDILQAVLAWALLVFWVVGVAYLTFPDNNRYSPATQPGNLYFFTWGSFSLCAYLALTDLMNLFFKGDEGEAAPKEQDEKVEKDEGAAAEEGEAGEKGEETS